MQEHRTMTETEREAERESGERRESKERKNMEGGVPWQEPNLTSWELRPKRLRSGRPKLVEKR